MLKKDITFVNLDKVKVTKSYYFNMTEMELLETELKFKGGLEALVQELRETEDAPRAYQIFKDIILELVGERTSADTFKKSDEYREEFESSLAFSALIIGFLKDPASGAKFIEQVLPDMNLEEVTAQDVQKAAGISQVATDAPSTPAAPKPKALKDMTREELLAAAEAKAAEKT